MKLVSYNVENLFLRARAMNEEMGAEGTEALKIHQRLNAIFAKPKYTAADKKTILDLLTKLGVAKQDNGGKYAVLRQNKGKLLKRPPRRPVEVVADGRGAWIGWLDLKTEDVNEIATRATARVIKELNPDVLGVVEAESRPALVRFSEGVLKSEGGKPYEHIMLIDGNDERGIDVGVLTRKGYDLTSMNSHVDDSDSEGQIFSRDCPAYFITTPKGNDIVLLVNHLKSKIDNGDARRLRQASRVKAIYKALVATGHDLVAVIGDFNDSPDSAPLAPLLKQTDLKDISTHAAFDGGERVGTYGDCRKDQKIDYLLMSPNLFNKVSKGGIFRMGVWGGKNGTLFPHFPEITKKEEAASDHAAIWAEFDA